MDRVQAERRADLHRLRRRFQCRRTDGQTQAEARRSLEESHAHKQQWPKTLFVPTGYSAAHLVREAEKLGIEVVRVPESELLVFIGEARESFKDHFGGSGIH